MALEEFEVRGLCEGVDFEAKKAAGRDGQGQLPASFWETYSAMANTEGGAVLLGLEEFEPGKFQASGISDPHRVIKQLWDGANNREIISCNVLSNDDVSIVVIDGKNIVCVRIPRATRFQIPVYTGKQPFGSTFRRNFEGDYRCDDEAVKRMLADQVEDIRDGKLLENFSFDDINRPTLQAYRTAFSAVRPDHPWVDLEEREFLRSLGGWTQNRETKREGLTLAGLLMFGRLPSILEAVPHYVVDYQERPADAAEDSDRRWIDRVTTDGTWSGNLYDFYRTAIQRLTQDLKVPFKLKDSRRIDDSPVHEALREALTNLIIHSDFTGRASLYVVKRQNLFGFRNPGLMRVPTYIAIQGGTSDCRNRNLQKMFQLVGLAEQAGSGLPKVFKNWTNQHWRRPELFEHLLLEQTILRLRPLSLLPAETLAELDARFGQKFRELPEAARLALATVSIEGSVTHSRLKEMSTDHPKDLSRTLSNLVDEGFLESKGVSRGTTYYFAGDLHVSEGEDSLETSIEISPSVANSLHTGRSSQQLSANSQRKESGSQQSEVPDAEWAALEQLADAVRKTRRAPRQTVNEVIVRVCQEHYLTAQQLGKLLNREALTLQTHYLNALVEQRALMLKFEKLNHPQQAYRAIR